ncbi:MAG: SMP-30/gluconolactonase/LRE family protein [Acidobacteria bacterium]|nr:SMP-30/gluconolactonase/LRE family protein [Acidobacteriota bacterium]
MQRRKFVSILASAAPLLAQEEYKQGPDSFRQEGVPKGTITAHKWTNSKLFPGTTRDYWVYVPAQYSSATPAPVMIFQDGGGMIREDGNGFKVPVVLDNLIHKKDLPPIIAIFINPGVLPGANGNAQGRYNRSLEYDGLGDRYARFLIEEILPEAGKSYSLSKNPDHYGLAGSSSGGIAAFNAAWSRPDQFRRVLSFIGSFVNLRGAQILPTHIRKFEPKPLRVFLQDGSNDNDIYGGSWWIANQDMARSLEWAGYESKFIKGTEAHNSKHGSAILPDALRWLWKDFPKPVARPINTSDRHWLNTGLIPGKDWELVGSGYGYTEGPAVDKTGQVFFTDIPNNRIHKIGLDGRVTVFKENSGGANGLMFGADGRLYGCQNGKKQIVAWSMDGAETVLATGVESNDLCLNAKGQIWFTDPRNKKIWFLDTNGNKKVVHDGLEFPNGILLSTDQTLLNVCDSRGRWVWSFSVNDDGSLSNGQPFHHLEVADESSATGADGLTVDTDGHIYVATGIGLQICDQPGRVVAILNKPQAAKLSNVVFGGPDLTTLYATSVDRVYKREIKRKGVYSWAPVKPPMPRL